MPRIDFSALFDPAEADRERRRLRRAAEEIGFMVVHRTPITRAEVEHLIETYRAFFHLPVEEKETVNMARTGASRGWGAPRAERVDPTANPDYKEVFDCGFELAPDDPLARLGLPAYAPNQWPERPAGFRETVMAYYERALGVSRRLLGAIAAAIGERADYFDDKFTRPMALLRANWYPPRPAWAGAKDFGIAPHTDYGCLTLLASDGTPGLEVEERDGRWIGVDFAPGEFVVNFGEMLEIWTGGRVRATPHRVIGSEKERISVPMFVNPN
ncbi:MAG: isopenicillin N synthase family oxygenase, partial [Alphaproteobacteria bacterium]